VDRTGVAACTCDLEVTPGACLEVVA